ncbi:UvrD-helicase domain-containing protein [Thermomonas sp.]|jgi:ATP-dependent DNA helicase Rep|uniref:UvrD-helicase domain-containing protein n=1 Tax=Thermomonas sp. TaxID=1971895 RepID=UPI001B73EB63|nr:UvrD-helicase domain-containing protein [Thermomonas sp.]MBK6415447.1 UvrD-helicase domain-containing protein [Thermomonas sp.]MBK7205999.1 UvrD-helicase domain-containing protein [Thermomonas sp.]MBL0228495.1 UvrD-helicase domain-containing protein [Thermomonas sp.]MBP7789021.1 UvrD-helicase domain-containing protein [Thermomonas sp.]HQX94270.1 UvrD-helicase domain-containing protein [Thermomonas sp.]
MRNPALHGLNPPQQQAVLHTEGPLLVLAGAGSGKTRVIIEKIAHLIHTGRYPAKRIAAITFTNKSAREMRERVARRIRGDAAQDLTVSTFHALGLRILQVEHARLGLRRGFSIFDADDSAAQLKDLLPPGSKPDVVDAAKQLIGRAKNAGLSPQQAAEAARSAREHEAAALYARYQQRLSAFNAVDFDDLIRLPVQLLESDADAVAGWRERIGYLLVDECQDTNDAQYRLLKAIAGEPGQFTVVGDDDQSIYAWRGANPDNLLQLGSDYPALRIVKLEQNYRCSNRVLRAANALIANNPHEHPKTLWSDAADGERIRVWECRDAAHEAEKVAAEIQFTAQKHAAPWSEFCILFRGNHQSRALEKSLQLLRIPYHLSGGTAFLDRGEVKDALAWLRLLANPDDDAAFLRAVAAPNRGVGATSLAKLAELAAHAHLPLARAAESMAVAKQLPARAANALQGFTDIVRGLRGDARTLPPAELVRRLNERSGLLAALRALCKDEAQFQARRRNLDELADWFDGPRTSGPGELAAALALLSHADKGDAGNQVRLMSMHAAKGLEFRFVFIVGVEDGNLPHEASIEEGRIDEERRLLYVGITRAREQLWLSHASQAQRWGDRLRLRPSRFLDELPAAELQRDGADPVADAARKAERASAGIANIRALLGE